MGQIKIILAISLFLSACASNEQVSTKPLASAIADTQSALHSAKDAKDEINKLLKENDRLDTKEEKLYEKL